MKKILLLTILSILLSANTICNAELKVFSKSAKVSLNVNETIDSAKERAFRSALRSISDEAGVYVESYTKIENHQLSIDTVTVISSNVVSVNSVEYSPILYSSTGQREVSAKVIATIDSENITKMSQKLQHYQAELDSAKKELYELRLKTKDTSRAIIINPVPNIIISHNTLWGEIDMNDILFKTHLIPKDTVTIFKGPYEDASIVGSASHSDSLSVIATEMHSYPQKGKTKIIAPPFEDFIHISSSYSKINEGKVLPNVGEYIYLLKYCGEGVFEALYRDNKIFVPYNGIKNISDKYDTDKIHRGFYAIFEGIDNDYFAETWVCIRNSNGLEGWVKISKNFERVESVKNGRGIFHYDSY